MSVDEVFSEAKENLARRGDPAISEFEIWEDAVDLPTFRETAPLCAGLLGEMVSQFVAAVATETATPLDLSALAALGVCSTVIAGSVVVEADPGWLEPVNLYLIALAGSGEGKSPVVSRCARVLDDIEQVRLEVALPRIVEAQARKRIAEGRRKRAEEAATKAGPADRLELEQEALEAAQDVEKILVPASPRVYTREATPEAIVKLLGEQHGRLGVITDEGVEFFELAARYSGSGKGNLGVYLSGHDGTRYVSDRAGREPIIVDAATLTVCLFAQPVVLGDLGHDRQVRGRGLLARFLWSMPGTKVGSRPIHRDPVPPHLTDGWQQRIEGLAREASGVGNEPIRLGLDQTARALLNEWRLAHEPRLLAARGDLAGIVDWGSKLPGQILRIAGNLHALRTGKIRGVISEETLRAALVFADYFIDHARTAFAVMGADRAMEDAGSVLHWLRAREMAEVTTRDIYTSKDWDVDRTKPALETLERYGWLRKEEKLPGPGRHAERWLVHPKLRSRTAQYSVNSAIVRHSAPVIAAFESEDEMDCSLPVEPCILCGNGTTDRDSAQRPTCPGCLSRGWA